MCPICHVEIFPWHTTFTVVPFKNFFFYPTSVFIVRSVCVYIHAFDSVEIVYELPLLPNNTATETFLHKSGAV